MSLIEDDQSTFPFLTELTGIPDDFFKGYNCASSKFKFSMHLSEISIIISHIMHSDRCKLDSSLFPVFLDMVESTNDDELRMEILENALLNFWMWVTSNPAHLQKIARQLTNYLSQFRFPEECELFTECLVQSHLFQNYSSFDVSVFQSVKMKVLKLLPLQSKHLPCLVSVILSLRDPTQIADYLNLLLKKEVEVPFELLIPLTDIVEFCSFSQSLQILNLITMATTGKPTELQVCFVQIVLRAKEMEIFQSLPNQLDIFCIEALRTNSAVELSKGLLSLGHESSRLWYFWPVLVALYLDEKIIEFVIGNMQKFAAQQLPSQFTRVLNLLAILRATRAFPKARTIMKTVLCEILDFVTLQKANFTKTAVKQIILRSFASIYYKMKLTSTSSALMKLWRESPFVESTEEVHDPRSDIEGTFSYDNLQRIFGSYLDQMKFVQAHSKHVDTDVTNRILVLLQAVFGDSEDDRTISMIRTYLTEKSRFTLLNEVFDFFSSGQDSVEILTQQVKTALAEINSYLNPKLGIKFDQHDILTSYYNAERMRLKKIYQCVEYEHMIDAGVSPRFARFPLLKYERSNWVVNLHDSFSMAKGQCVVENVTLVHSAPCKMVTIFGRINVTFILLLNEIRISQIGKPVTSIKFEAVNVIMSILPRYLEIYTSACQSTLLYFSTEHYNTILEKIKTCPLKLVTSTKDGNAKVMKLWSESKITNMDLILGLNFMAGRSFNDIYFYPIAPIINNDKFCSTFNLVDNKKYITTVSRWLLTLNLVRNNSLPNAEFLPQNELTLAINGPGCVPPQLYFSFYSFDSSLHGDIYRARRSMDTIPEVSKKIHAWVETQFGVSLPAKESLLKKTDVTLQSVIRHDRVVVNASFFSNSTDMFFAQFDDDMIEIYNLNLASVIPTLTVIRKFTGPFVFDDRLSYCALRNKLLLFDWKNCLTYRINDRTRSEKVISSIPTTAVAPLGDYIVFVVDRNLICISPGDRFPLTRRTICAESEQVLLLQTSLTFQVVVYVTEHQEMKIVSIFSSRVIGSLTFTGEQVTKILITDNLGFVVVKTDKHLYTCSTNGSILSSIDFQVPVHYWVALTVKGVDFVIIIDGDNNLMFCEAFHLNSMKQINRLKKTIIAMKPSHQKDTLVMVSSDSKVIMLPLPF